MNTGIEVFQKEASLPTEAEFENLTRQAKIFITSGFLPSSIKTPEQAITIAIKGRELGIPPMQAFAHINIISGKPAMSAELMLALCFRGCPTAIIEFIQNDNKGCVIDARRRGTDKPSRFSFNLDDALAAQLLGKDSWKKYPAAMLRARCISAMGRALFPDCLMGVSYTAEELGVEVDEEGRTITIPKVAEAPKVEPVIVEEPPTVGTVEPAKAYEWMWDVTDGKVVEWEEGMSGPLDWLKYHIGEAKTTQELLALQDVAKKTLDEAGYKAIYPHINLTYKAKVQQEKKATKVPA